MWLTRAFGLCIGLGDLNNCEFDLKRLNSHFLCEKCQWMGLFLVTIKESGQRRVCTLIQLTCVGIKHYACILCAGIIMGVVVGIAVVIVAVITTLTIICFAPKRRRDRDKVS